MEQLLATASSANGLLMALLTAGLLIANIVSAIVAVLAVRENIILRKAGTEPQVIAYIRSFKRAANIIEMHLENVGSGPAFEVTFRVTDHRDELPKHGLELPLDGPQLPITAIPQGDSLRFMFGMAPALLKEPCCPGVAVAVSFKNSRGQKLEQRFRLDVHQLLGTGTFEGPDVETARSIKRISENIDRLVSGFGKLTTVTATPSQWREEEDRWRRLADEADGTRTAAADELTQ